MQSAVYDSTSIQSCSAWFQISFMSEVFVLWEATGTAFSVWISNQRLVVKWWKICPSWFRDMHALTSHAGETWHWKCSQYSCKIMLHLHPQSWLPKTVSKLTERYWSLTCSTNSPLNQAGQSFIGSSRAFVHIQVWTSLRLLAFLNTGFPMIHSQPILDDQTENTRIEWLIWAVHKSRRPTYSVREVSGRTSQKSTLSSDILQELRI